MITQPSKTDPTQVLVSWDKIIKSLLKAADDKQIPVKKLRKMLLPEYNKHTGEEMAKDEFKALLEGKIEGSSKVELADGIVSLC